LHSNLFYADPGFDHPEDVPILIGAELFFYLIHPGRYFDSGRVPTLQENVLGLILGGDIQHPGLPFREAVTSCLTLEENSLDAQVQCFSMIKKLHILECESHFPATIT
jgi:hypothetical protein